MKDGSFFPVGSEVTITLRYQKGIKIPHRSGGKPAYPLSRVYDFEIGEGNNKKTATLRSAFLDDVPIQEYKSLRETFVDPFYADTHFGNPSKDETCHCDNSQDRAVIYATVGTIMQQIALEALENDPDITPCKFRDSILKRVCVFAPKALDNLQSTNADYFLNEAMNELSAQKEEARQRLAQERQICDFSCQIL